MAPKKVRKNQSEGSTSKRIKTQAIPLAHASNVLDLSSESIPENLRCPICVEVPLGEVYQCPNGHLICNSCQLKSGKLQCSQCREFMKSLGGDYIRNRFMEEHLDSHRFLCPLRKNGCLEVLSRGDVQKHKDECVYDGNHVQICQYFDSTGQDCPFWTHILNPKDSLSHLYRHFSYVKSVVEGEDSMHFWFPVNLRTNADYVQATVVTLKNGTTLMVIGWNKKEAVSFACVSMNKPRPGPARVVKPRLVRLTFENQKTNGVSNMSLTFPIIPVLDAKPVLERKIMWTTDRLYLEEYYLDKDFEKPCDHCLKVTIDIIELAR